MTEAVRLQEVRLTLQGGGGPVDILNGVDLVVPAGKAVGIMGPSGSGKTTMLMITAGLERPSSGRVEVAGRDLMALGEDQLAVFRRGHVGIVFQGFHLIPTMTALENVALPLEFAGRGDARRLAAQALDSVGLARRQAHYPAQLSGGEQQRVALARAFAPEPALILADEPTGNLDAATGQVVMDLMFGLAAQKAATLVLITHDRQLAARADALYTMRDGVLSPAGEG